MTNLNKIGENLNQIEKKNNIKIKMIKQRKNRDQIYILTDKNKHYPYLSLSRSQNFSI